MNEGPIQKPRPVPITDIYAKLPRRKDIPSEGFDFKKQVLKTHNTLSRSRNQPGQLLMIGSLNYRLFV